MKKFLHECDDCGFKGSTAKWKVEGYKGPAHIKELFLVMPEFGPDPNFFDLDIIDSKVIEDKYNVSAEEAETFILEGQPLCPECESEKYFRLAENLSADNKE